MHTPVYHQKSFLLFGSALIMVFLTLMFFRLDLHNRWFNAPTQLDQAAAAAVADRNSWMNIFRDDAKIGYAHRRLAKTPDGYQIDETVYMRLRTMGLVQDLSVKTTGNLNPDFSLADFQFAMSSSRFQYLIVGQVDGNRLQIRTQAAGTTQDYAIELKKPPYLAAGMTNAVYAAGLKAGERYSFDVFDPTTMGQAEVLVSVVGKETILHAGQPVDATKILITFKGANQVAWLDDQGHVIQEKGLLGLRLEKTGREDALSGITGEPGSDLVGAAAVASNLAIDRPERLKQLVVQINGVSEQNLYLAGGRQSFSNPVLTVTKESLDDLPEDAGTVQFSNLEYAFLYPGPFIQSDHPSIRQLAAEIVTDPQAAPITKAKQIVDWVYRNIKKRPVLSVPDALTTLHNKEGDCNEHAVLVAAIARAAGLPARVEVGLVYMKDKFYYHAWNLLYVGRWVTADGVFGQLPADVTHIRLATGSKNQLDLMGVIGRIQLKVIEAND